MLARQLKSKHYLDLVPIVIICLSYKEGVGTWTNRKELIVSDPSVIVGVCVVKLLFTMFHGAVFAQALEHCTTKTKTKLIGR